MESGIKFLSKKGNKIDLKGKGPGKYFEAEIKTLKCDSRSTENLNLL